MFGDTPSVCDEVQLGMSSEMQVKHTVPPRRRTKTRLPRTHPLLARERRRSSTRPRADFKPAGALPAARRIRICVWRWRRPSEPPLATRLGGPTRSGRCGGVRAALFGVVRLQPAAPGSSGAERRYRPRRRRQIFALPLAAHGRPLAGCRSGWTTYCCKQLSRTSVVVGPKQAASSRRQAAVAAWRLLLAESFWPPTTGGLLSCLFTDAGYWTPAAGRLPFAAYSWSPPATGGLLLAAGYSPGPGTSPPYREAAWSCRLRRRAAPGVAVAISGDGQLPLRPRRLPATAALPCRRWPRRAASRPPARPEHGAPPAQPCCRGRDGHH